MFVFLPSPNALLAETTTPRPRPIAPSMAIAGIRPPPPIKIHPFPIDSFNALYPFEIP
jgi:hypothetical protein